MLYLGSTYLIVKDISQSEAFYRTLLATEPEKGIKDRWIRFFVNGSCIALFNSEFDRRMIEIGVDLEDHYDRKYVRYFKNRRIRYGNNMVLHFTVDNLHQEHRRLRKLYGHAVSEIMSLNISAPYSFFVLEDPDGNTIEITGNSEEH